MPGHYMNHCWLIVNYTIKNKFHRNCNRNSPFFIEPLKKMRLQLPSAKCRAFFSGFNELIATWFSQLLCVIYQSLNHIVQILLVHARYPRGSFHKKNWKIYISRWIENRIRSQLCTCHDSWAVVTCANLRPHSLININFEAKVIFTRFQW